MDDDFDSLPPVVRRKFFSTLERLRLAQSPISTVACTGSGSVRRKPGPGKIQSGPRLPRPTRNCKTTCLDSSSPHRRKKLQSNKGPCLVSQADAQWFLRLPDKVRKKQFSREEQVLLAGRRQTVILDGADKALYRLGRENTNSVGTGTTLRTSTLSVEHSVCGSEATAAADMDDAMENCFRWMDDEEELDLKLDDYHIHLAETATAASTSSAWKPTFRRRISINSTGFGRASTSSDKRRPSQVSSPLPSPSLPASHSRTKSRPQSAVSHQPRYPRRPSIPLIDPAAKHYRDPEARLKLRVYLASPQKFDEAIEFGFPSLETHDSRGLPQPISTGNDHTGHCNAVNAHTFLNDDAASLWEDDRCDADEGSLPDIDTPETPSVAAFKPIHRLSTSCKPNLTDSTGLPRPHTKSKASDPYSHALIGGREMTLRMTLTRPDLRDDETALYDWNDGLEKGDPLALEELPLGPDTATAVMGPLGGPDGWGPIKDDGVVKRMWKKVSRRTC